MNDISGLPQNVFNKFGHRLRSGVWVLVCAPVLSVVKSKIRKEDKMKESPHVTLTEEQEKRETTICIVWASVVVLGMLALMLTSLGYFSSATVTGQNIYAIDIMQKKILRLEELTAGLYSVYSEDKKNRLDYKPPSNAGWVSPARITKGGWAR